MGKISKKLIAALLAVILSVTVVAVSSYAWLIQSTSPQIEGMYVSVGGGNTILLAADLTVEEEGQIYHFPGGFTNRLNFSQYESYSYLQDLGGLTPVSTADGLNWYLPTYYEKNDPLAKAGVVSGGQIKPFEEFVLDDRLLNANLTAEQREQIEQGNYIYLDFWVVSPSQNYRLRISTGDDTSGSFAIGLPEATGVDRDGDGEVESYALSVAGGEAAASSIRVGFLVNEEPITDLSMFYYQRSEQFAGRYNQLRGIYNEKALLASDRDHRFLIYEPNGDLHQDAQLQGCYVITRPLAKTDSGVALENISSRLTVQATNTWLMAEDNLYTRLQLAFDGSAVNEVYNKANLQRVCDKFYKSYLQEQLAAYVDKADFYTHTGNLYAMAKNDVVSQEMLDQNAKQAGATNDVYIVDLEKNVPQRIRMFIWLEGQDIDCTNDAAASGVAINIELAGSSDHD